MKKTKKGKGEVYDGRSRVRNEDFTPENHRSIYSRLAVAISHDLHELSVELAEKAKYTLPMDLIEGGGDQIRIQRRFSKSLEYFTSDTQWCIDHGTPLSHSIGMESVLKLYEAKKAGDPEKVEKAASVLLEEVNASLVALIWRGCAEMAFDITRFAGTLARLDEINKNTDPFGGHSGRIAKFKILFKIQEFLLRFEVPTQKALHQSCLPNLDKAHFSRMLATLRVQNSIPADTTSPKSIQAGKGTVHRLNLTFPDLDKIFFDIKEILPDFELIKHITDAPSNPHQPIILWSMVPEMIDNDIRKIKEHLGEVYSILLHKFGMNQIESYEDLQIFESNLSKIGLGFVNCCSAVSRADSGTAFSSDWKGLQMGGGECSFRFYFG